MPRNEDQEKKRKREAEEWWKRVLAYYMMEEYALQQDKVDEILRSSFGLSTITTQMIQQRGLLRSLFARGEDKQSAFELLREMEDEGEMDLPFQDLLDEMRKDAPSEEKVNKEVAKVIVEAPALVIANAKREKKQRRARRASYGDIAKEFVVIDDEDIKYERKLKLQAAFLRKVMPKDLFSQLLDGLRREGYSIDQQVNDVHIDEYSLADGSNSYEQFVAKKMVDPKEKPGKGELANSGDVYTAAAYMIAAYEQKDDPTFDEQKADARAMELSGSRAFHVYMNGHPGSLVAAARNTGVGSTHDDIMALDAELTHRDAVLGDVRDALKGVKSGKTACFHQMYNALDRFVNSDEEPSARQRSELINGLGEYVFTDCAPDSKEADQTCFLLSMRALKVLLPEKDFTSVLEEANKGRDPILEADQIELGAGGPERVPGGPKLSPERML